MKKLIKLLFQDFFYNLIHEVLEDRLEPIVLFYVGDENVEIRNMFVYPRIGWTVKLKAGNFLVKNIEIISTSGYEIHVTGKFI